MYLKIFVIFNLIFNVLGTFTGPFFLWGRSELSSVKLTSAFQQIDDKTLRNIYSNSNAILMFLRNSSTSLDEENYPNFKQIITKREWIYLPQHWLTSDPVDYNINAEVINLVGPASQQDLEMSVIYADAEMTYGEGKVLGILATKSDEHDIRKREAIGTEEPSMSTTVSSISSTTTPVEEQMEENFIYIDSGKAMLYTTSPPLLIDNGVTTELRLHSLAKSDRRPNELKFHVTFRVNRTNNESTKLFLRFRFPFASGYWSLNSVEVEEPNRKIELPVVDEPPTAPFGFSYKCSKTIVFREGNTSLVLENIQVQPTLDDKQQFGDAYDCVGFTTAPIWSGIFVSSLFLLVLTIGILGIMDIKTPSKFENSRGKQLTFTVQE